MDEPLMPPGLRASLDWKWYRVAMPYDPGRDMSWHTGLCGEYALALHRLYPHLRIGWQGYYDPNDEMADEDFKPYFINHIFAHDDAHAYDVFGKHPLEAMHPGDLTDEGHEAMWATNKRPDDLQWEWPIQDHVVDEAVRRIQQDSSPEELPEAR